MKNSIIIVFGMFCFISVLPSVWGQGENKTFIDLHVNTSKKPFNSRSIGLKYGLWEPMYHECGTEEERSKTVMQNIGEIVPKQSQSHLEALVKGNTRIACLNLSPIEQQFIGTNSALTDKNKKKTISCVSGVNANQLFLRRKEIDYFKDLVENINFIERFENKPYMINGFEYNFSLIRNQKELEEIEKDNNRVGMVLTVEGGHSLGHSIYINDGITGLEEYKALILENVDRLKGSRPLIDGSDIYLDIPILWISLCKSYKNGFGGNANSLNKAQQGIYAKPEGLNAKETSLGVDVIERLISKDKGRRILIDIKHMSLDFRTRYYKTIERSEILGDGIPVICSHCGISGLSKRNALYKKRDEDSKNNNYYLNHWQQNLSSEDIGKIFLSKGLIGITLDKTVLGGQTALTQINETLPNTVQKRKACIKLLMANILTVIRTINDASAWDHVAIGSDFDEMAEPLDAYQTSEDLPQLAVDIQRFLERPEAINDLFSEEDIRELMFDLTPTEITGKIMSLNAYNFISRHISNVNKE
ncbi:dipeptidase [Aureispira anguillae]|uniref:Dipeptidase n=1 Tax=Aureispira anguillae TaxID=2864201 RepID=A0A915YI92_9BACT|nr:dipeptidase [Aureispira anguillae]BDS13545.1 dipeptidase [Aureispira anguillae]